MAPGSAIAHYQITAKLGEGGMGAVYRATDTKLNREVAIKVLPPAFADDPARMARFHREAQLLATLNHANIAQIYGVEQNAIIMELVPGDELRGPVPVDTALDYAAQFAAGLDAAHERGIIHRDLKPANIKLTPDGVIKILDLGLGKATDAPTSSAAASPTFSPTLSLAMTQAGMIMGTAAYMSPEQARGKPVDRRADIWAFGVILYEIVTGDSLFGGETVTDILAAVVKENPPLDRVPPQLRRLLASCLQKDPKNRLQSIADWRLLLVDPTPAAAAPAAPSRRPILAWALAAAATLALGGLAFVHFRERPPDVQPLRATLLPPPNTKLDFTNGLGLPAISPDGTKVVFGAMSSDGKSPLWVRSLNGISAQPLAGTDGATFPFWSPDSRSIAFFADRKLKKVDAAGGTVVTLADARRGRGGSWSSTGVIVFSPDGAMASDVVVRVPAAGGAVTPLFGGRMPWFLPDGKHFLLQTLGELNHAGLAVASLDGGAIKPLAKEVSDAKYAQGHLLFVRDATLMAQPFDLQKLELSGEPLPIAERLASILNSQTVGVFSVSSNGLLIYGTGLPRQGSMTELTWFDRTGKTLDTLWDRRPFFSIAISPQGTRIATDPIATQSRNSHEDVWVVELATGAATRFTAEANIGWSPVWSPDGARIAFAAKRSTVYDIYVKAANGGSPEELLYKNDNQFKFPSDWSPDGKFLLYGVPESSDRSFHQWLLPLTGDDRKPRQLIPSSFDDKQGHFSPDGRYIAYSSNETGKFEVYVRPFPDVKRAKWILSKDGGVQPRWRRDGKELYFLSAGRKLMAAQVSTSGEFQTGTTTPLFSTAITSTPTGVETRYDVTADGKKFLMISEIGKSEEEQSATDPLTLFQNWTALLKK